MAVSRDVSEPRLGRIEIMKGRLKGVKSIIQQRARLCLEDIGMVRHFIIP